MKITVGKMFVALVRTEEFYVIHAVCLFIQKRIF